MIATIIGVVLLIIAIRDYSRRKYVLPMVIFAFFATNGFIVNWGTSPFVKFGDMGLLQLAISCMIGYYKDIHFFSLRGSKCGKLVAIFLCFFFVEVIYSLAIDADDIKGIITVVRSSLAVLSYWVFRRASMQDINKVIVIVFKVVIVVSSLFVLQYLTHIEFVNTYISENNLSRGNYRMQVSPPFIGLFLLYLLCYNPHFRFKWGSIILFFVVLLITQNRTPVLGILLQLFVFFILSKNVKRKFSLIILGALAFPIVASMLGNRSEEGEEESILDIKVLQYLQNQDYRGLALTSTFMFRIALIAERANYLVENPEKSLLGVGAIDENSKKIDQFDFTVGTAGVNEKGQPIIAQLNSIDVLWGPILIRYGLLGIFLHLYLMVNSGLLFYKFRSSPVMMIGLLMIISAFATSFSSGGFFNTSSCFVLSIFWIICDKEYLLRTGSEIKVARLY